MKSEKSIFGKYKQSFEIEYELKQPDVLFYDNNPKTTISFAYNKKQIRTFKKGVKLTVKYLARMKRLGFTPVEQVKTDEDIKRANGKNGEIVVMDELQELPPREPLGFPKN